MLVCGCTPEPEPDEVRPIVAHLAPGCRESADSLIVQLNALGDFDASNLTSEALPGTARGVEISFPEATRAVEAVAEGSRGRFSGLADADPSGRLDVLLWGDSEACRLWDPNSAPSRPYPGATGGEAFGRTEDGRYALVAGGLTEELADNARALLIRLDTGKIEEIPGGMAPGRAFASVTQFGSDSMLVAGGSDPTLATGDLNLSPPIGSAIVLSLEELRFDVSNRIALSNPRTRHGAVVLQDGRTLLVGGVGSTGVPLASLELVSPVDRTINVADVTSLKLRRASPFVTKLTDQRVFVAGGTGQFGDVEPSVEWISADAKDHVRLREDLVFASRQAFAPLPGGTVLAVGVCVPGKADCAQPEAAVTFLRADGSADPLTPLTSGTENPVLLPASDGAPWLAAGSGDQRVMKRYDPWSGMFVQPADRPTRVPDGVLPALAFDAGSFGFLAKSGNHAEVLGFRHGTRSIYAQAAAPLLVGSADHLVPDRAPGGEVRFDAMGLHLDGKSATAHLADAQFADVQVDLELTSGEPPIVVLGDVRIGTPACPWPEGEVAIQLRVTRSKNSLTARRGDRETKCEGPKGRVPLALRASGGASVIRSLALHRTVP